MRDILKRIFIGVAIGMSLFSLKSQVFAAQVPLSNNKFQYSRHLCGWGETSCTDYYISGYSNFGTWLSIPGTGSGLTRYYLVATYYTGTATLQVGNTYTIIYRTQFNPKSSNILNQINSLQYNVYGYNGSTYTDALISTQSCSTRNVVTHDYAVETTCVFQVNSNASGFLIRSVYNLTEVQNTSITMSNAQASSSQSEVGAINELTSSMKYFFQLIMSQNNEIYGSPDDSATWFPNDNYDTTDYDNAESTLDSYLDTDVSSLTFDPTDWSHTFSYIWYLVTSFVQINAKVFATITAFLTFSFTALVLGRR